MTLWRLEVARLVRTHRWMILFGVYAFFGAVGPLTPGTSARSWTGSGPG